ncbi:hypothetical protein EP342_00680 [bacterium]|nr:MAG: hypothetical protein EP342_00680 [bacterium]
MCTIHFIGTNQKLVEVKFDKDNPNFWIEKYDKEKLVSFQVGKKNTYIVGTSEGCGCKFGMEPIPTGFLNKAKLELNNGEEFSADIQQFFDWQETEEQLMETFNEHNQYDCDTEKLFELLKLISQRENSVEFFGSWEEDEKKKKLNVKELNIKDLKANLNWAEFSENPTKIVIRNE